VFAMSCRGAVGGECGSVGFAMSAVRVVVAITLRITVRSCERLASFYALANALLLVFPCFSSFAVLSGSKHSSCHGCCVLYLKGNKLEARPS
jgi:hypothetical protein